MATKPIKDSVKLTHYWRWQFLRLNQCYRKIFDQAQERADIAEYFRKEVCQEFGINGLYDYHCKTPPWNAVSGQVLHIDGEIDFTVQKGSLESIFKNKPLDNQQIVGHYLVETRQVPDSLEQVEVSQGVLENRPRTATTVKCVQVVINRDAELGDIQREIKAILTEVRVKFGKRWKAFDPQKSRRKLTGLSRPQKRKKAVTDLKNCLKAWTFFKKHPSPKQVVNKMFPKAYSKSKETLVCHYRTKAQEFIDGRYKEISFI